MRDSQLILGGYYRSNNPRFNAVEQQTDFENSLQNLKSATQQNDTIILGGDFNLKDINWDTETVLPGSFERTASQMLVTSLNDHHLQQMQREPTRESSVLDLFITNKPSLVKNFCNIPNISDHEGAILADTNIRPSFIKKKPQPYLLLSKANWDKMKCEMSAFSAEFHKQSSLKSVDENWDLFKNALQKTISENVPSRTPKSKREHPWISANIRRKIRKKHRLFKKAKKSRDPDHFSQFKSFKKSTQKDIRDAKTFYINNNVVGGLEKGDTKPFYRFIKSKKNDNIGLAPLKNGPALETSSIKKADILLDEFSSVFTREDTDSIPWLGPAKAKIGDIHVTQQGVNKLLKDLKVHKASGPDKIPNRVLKELAEEIAPILTTIFNQSLSSGTTPTDWKNALITPVYKKGNVHMASNYRPVSLTCVACKLLEHIVCSHILTFLESHSLLTPLQHGFRKGHSCESQLLITLDDFFTAYDNYTQTDVGVLDFSRAFDTVPHERLLGKLAHYGIQGQTNDWIRAFLTGRQMQVVVDGEQSGSAPVLSGVPQGTVLGPLLFLIYINDMPDVVSDGTFIRLFADDCLAYRRILTAEDQAILQRDLESLHQWTIRWGMKFNPGKCNIMHLARRKALTKLYELCGVVLETVDSAKYLGVVVSDDLLWHKQVCAVAKKANSTLHLIARNLHDCPRATRALAYTTLVRPKLEYCASVWDPHLQGDIDTLERVNRRAARMVYNKGWRQQGVSVTSLMDNLGWESLAERREKQRVIMLYKISHGLIAVPPTRLTQPQRITRGHSRKYNVLSSSLDRVKYSFFPRTIPQWNNLNEEAVNAKNLDEFKAKLN